MRRLRINAPALVALILALPLLALLLLPLVVDLPDPAQTRLAADVGDRVMPPPYKPGQFDYLLGSDRAGRDLLARLAYGGRLTLSVALSISLLRAAASLPLGLLAGWYGGWAARLISAFSFGLGALPSLVLVTFALSGIRAVAQGNAWIGAYIGVAALAGAPHLAEQVRRLTREIAARPHVEAAVSLGAGPPRILTRHVLPLMAGNLAVAFAADVAWVLIMMGQLSVFGIYLGGTLVIERLGHLPLVLESQPEWGQMLGANRDLLRTHPWIPISPALGIGLAASCFQMLAEGLRIRWARRTVGH